MIQRNVKLLVFTKDTVARTQTGPINDIATAAAATGEAWVVDEANNVLTNTTTSVTKFKVCYKSGNGTIVYSDVIDPKRVISYKGKRSVAAVEQITYIGYNTTSGSITAINNNEYDITIDKQDLRETDFMQWKQVYGSYTSDSSATQSEVADGLVSNLTANFSKLPEITIKAEVVCSDAGSSITAASGTLTATKGSKYVAATGATLGTDFSVGYLVRFGAATSSPCYLVTAVDATNKVLTLSNPYSGTSGSFSGAGAQFITTAGIAAANFGVKLSGLAKKWSLLKFQWEKQRFAVLLRNFGATALTTPTGAYEGDGNYQQVAELEAFCQGNEVGTPQRSQSFGPIAIDYRTDYTFNNAYSLVNITYKDTMTTDLGQSADSWKELVVAFGASATASAATGTAVTDATTGVIVVLDAIIATSANVGSALVSVI